MVDSATNSDCAMLVLSNPMTDTEVGTVSPSARAADSTPNAERSLAAKIAVGGRRAVRSSRAAV
jgi:hypothetical protein